MEMTYSYPHLSMDQPVVYRILVLNRVSEGWKDWFEGMRLMHVNLGCEVDPLDTGSSRSLEATLLTGPVPDQAALLGILQRLYSFQLPILRVEIISPNEA